jgi:hypothetical protein
VPERLPRLDKAARKAHAAGLGKLLPEDLYLEKGLVARLPAALRAQVAKGEKVAGRKRHPYNLVKIGLDGKRVSFLSYPQLETAKLPELARTAAVRLDTKTVRVIDYSQRAQPPVLHRKELVMGKKCKAKKNPAEWKKVPTPGKGWYLLLESGMMWAPTKAATKPTKLHAGAVLTGIILGPDDASNYATLPTKELGGASTAKNFKTKARAIRHLASLAARTRENPGVLKVWPKGTTAVGTNALAVSSGRTLKQSAELVLAQLRREQPSWIGKDLWVEEFVGLSGPQPFVSYTFDPAKPSLRRIPMKKAKKRAKGKKNPLPPAASPALQRKLAKRNRAVASFATTAKRRAFAAVTKHRMSMSDMSRKVSFAGWGIKDGLTHRYNARAVVAPGGSITIHWSNKSAKGKTAAKALDAAAKKGLLPTRTAAAQWRDGDASPVPRSVLKAMAKVTKAKKNPSPTSRAATKARAVERTRVVDMPDGSKRYMVKGKFATKAKYDARKKELRKQAERAAKRGASLALKAKPKQAPFRALKKGDKFWWSPDRLAREVMTKVSATTYKMSKYFRSMVHTMENLDRKVHLEIKKAKKNPKISLPKGVLRAQKAAAKAATKADPKPAKKKAPKKLVFHAKTSGGKWGLKAWRVGRQYESTESRRGGSVARRIGYSKQGMTAALVDSITGSKTWDGINYIIQKDELGVQDLLDKLKPVAKKKKPTKVPKSVVAAAKKAATKAARKNPATGLTKMTAQQAKLDLENRGHTDIRLAKSNAGHTLRFPAWAKAKPHQRVYLIATFSQPYVGEGQIDVKLEARKPKDTKRSKVGERSMRQSIQAVPLAGIMAGKQYQAHKPVAAGKTKAKRRPGVLAGFFQNPAEEQKAWAVVQRVFKHERAAMKKGFADLFYTGLKPDKKVHDTERHYAMTGKNAKGEVWINISPALGLLPISKVRGVIRHELGHAAILHGYEPMVKGKTKTLAQYDRRERQADKVAEKLSGSKIYYDAKNIEASGPGAGGKRPRPKGLR